MHNLTFQTEHDLQLIVEIPPFQAMTKEEENVSNLICAPWKIDGSF